MLSERDIQSVQSHLAPLRGVHLSALATTVEQIRGYLETDQDTASTHDRAAAELGNMGSQNIDLDRFAALTVDTQRLAGASAKIVERAFDVLVALSHESEERFQLKVGAGEDLARAVGQAFARAGRAFGAARLVRLARNGGYRPAEHDDWLVELPFTAWTAAERDLAPPLLVELNGTELRPSALADYLDGSVKIVLLVDEPAPVAPLVRLITPDVFVAQLHDTDPVTRLAGHDGAGIVAVMPQGSASFVHDPSAGNTLAKRLSVTHLPDPPNKRVGAATVFQQNEELSQLRTLAAATTQVTAVETAPATVSSHPADKLAAWLLSQAKLAPVK